MKKLSISLLAIMCAFVGTAGAEEGATEIAGWGTYEDVTSAWGGVASYTSSQVDTKEGKVKTGLCTSNTNNTCKTKDSQECGFVDDDRCVYDVTEYSTIKDYQLKLATDTLFTQVLNELEKEAQGLYNAKLTEEQNMCRNANSGGLIGRNNMTGTYRWVKLRSSKVPKTYAASGLTDKQISNSNDLYGSFCAARVTLQSDDAGIQEAIRNGADWASVYFAVGDVFTCGSWIPQRKLEEIAESVAKKKLAAQGKDDLVTGAGTGKLTTNQKWWLAGATVLSAGAGGYGMDLLQTKTGLGGLLGTDGNNVRDNLTNDEIKAIRASLNTAETAFYDKKDGCNGLSTNPAEKVSRAQNEAKYITGVGYLYDYKIDTDAPTHSCIDLHNYITGLRKALGIDSNGTEKDPNKKRLGIDALASVGTGIAGFLATRETMKDANKKEYDAAEREAMNEFMSNVGSHIYCFIGAEEAGTFGDVVEVSME